MRLALLSLAAFALAYANGANDNSKGVATLLGSGAADYRRALAWATLCTVLGSLAAMALAGQVLQNFSGRGLVDDRLAGSPQYLGAAGLGAGLTVLLATRAGLPISTTHSLVGALVGAGWAAGSFVNTGKLAIVFFAPLLGTPLLAGGAAAIGYRLLHRARLGLGVSEHTCLCAGGKTLAVVPAGCCAATLESSGPRSVLLADTAFCRSRYAGRVLGIEASAALDGAHYLSAGAVSFARALNDTPKIAAVVFVAPLFGHLGSTLAVALPMALGGLLSARRVAEVMSRKITPMNPGQGFVANLVTSLIVVGASRFGMPASTTHVACGALFGIGAATAQARPRIIAAIVFAWVATLPLGAVLGALSFRILVCL